MLLVVRVEHMRRLAYQFIFRVPCHLTEMIICLDNCPIDQKGYPHLDRSKDIPRKCQIFLEIVLCTNLPFDFVGDRGGRAGTVYLLTPINSSLEILDLEEKFGLGLCGQSEGGAFPFSKLFSVCQLRDLTLYSGIVFPSALAEVA